MIAGVASDKSPSPIISAANTTKSESITSDIKSNSSNSCGGSVVPNHELRTEIRDGIEWVSFVYSHHRVLRRYSIRTDIDKVDLSLLDEKFKSDNCVSSPSREKNFLREMHILIV